VHGFSSGNNGVFGDSASGGASGVYGQNDGGGYGVAGRITKPGFGGMLADAGSTGSVGIWAQSLQGVGVNAIGGNTGFKLPALSIVGANTNSDLIDACPSGTPNNLCTDSLALFTVNSLGNVSTTAEVFAGGITSFGDFSAEGTSSTIFHELTVGGNITGNGNINILGQYQQNGSCFFGCLAANATSSGRAVVSYVPTQSLPSIDDFGEATLQNGSAFVRLDPSFANVIDHKANYLVFITPEGDSRGLYVAQKSAQGFAVRENMGGHSTLAFSYRIVAKPYGISRGRLPMVAIPALHAAPRRSFNSHGKADRFGG
jgi:hypothetical protein